MASTSQFNEASIVNLDTDEPPIKCMFRPKEYTFTKQNSWKSEEVIGENVPKLQFSGGGSTSLQMELFFDTYETGEDVRKYTDKIWKLMMINPRTRDKGHKGQPYRCEFRWGETWSFQAVITDLTQKFTLFKSDGTPLRSTMNVSFMQTAEAGKYPGQNPTTVSVSGYKTRKVRQGETIDWIAYDEYGDSALWRFLANTNNLENPLRLEVGQILAIAPLP
jgi:hypothetical protein